MKTEGSFYPGAMLWKPVVYQSKDRSIEQNTLMHVYPMKNNVTLQPIIDQGMFSALYVKPYVSAFNISLGQANDGKTKLSSVVSTSSVYTLGFFMKTNYTFIQFTAGLDALEPDSTKQFVSIALIVSLALPGIVGVIALIFIVTRRMSPSHASSYEVIEN